MPNTTGLAPLPDIGILAYNGVTFSSLQKTEVQLNHVLDNAGRTVKYLEMILTVSGYVTLEQGQQSIDATMRTLYQKLSQQGAQLTYSFKGLGQVFIVNSPGRNSQTPGGLPNVGLFDDVAWGPVTKVIDFQPLGGQINQGVLGNSSFTKGALVRWSVTTRIAPNAATTADTHVVQFNEEMSILFNEDGYASLSIKGTLEIALRRDTVDGRGLTQTVDDFRQAFMNKVGNSIDLTRFRVTKRQFDISRDKRTMEWQFLAEEHAPQALPIGMTQARGTMTVRPQNEISMAPWICAIKCTYVVRGDKDRRLAWAEFLALLKFRMEESSQDPRIPRPKVAERPDPPRPPNAFDIATSVGFALLAYNRELENYNRRMAEINQQIIDAKTLAVPLYFAFEEGLYLDSKTVTFEAAWRLCVPHDWVMIASGLWRYDYMVGGRDAKKAWALSMRDVSNWSSWLSERINPAADIIIDLGL